MGFLGSVRQKIASKMMGELVKDLGTLPLDENDRELSLSIRKRPDKAPHLQVKLGSAFEASYFSIPCSPQWAQQFEKVAQEMRAQLSPK